MMRLKRMPTVTTTVRLPHALHYYLCARAEHYNSTFNAEIVRLLREQMDRDGRDVQVPPTIAEHAAR